MAVPVSRLVCLYTPWTPSNERFVETVSIAMGSLLQRQQAGRTIKVRRRRSNMTLARRGSLYHQPGSAGFARSGRLLRFGHVGGDGIHQRRRQAVIGFEPELLETRPDPVHFGWVDAGL